MLALALQAGCVLGGARAPASPSADPGADSESSLASLVSGGIERTFLLHRPSSVTEGRRYPLVIGLHGSGSSAPEFHDWIHPDTATSQAGFFAVYPNGVQNSWNIGCPACSPAARAGVDDVRFVDDLIDHLADLLPVDTAKVFVFGHSLGAQFVYHYACEGARAAAGIASVGGLWLRRSASRCRRQSPISVLIIHGDRDRVLPFNGPRENISALSVPEAFERWSELQGCGGPPLVARAPDRAGDGTSVVTTTATGCQAGSEVTVHRIEGGGHGWPGPVRPFAPLGPHSWNLDGLEEVMSSFHRRALADATR